MYVVWIPVYGFEDCYEVSNMGEVKNKAGMILKPASNRGYKHIALSKNKVPKTVYIHRAVLESFCGPPPFEGAEACHNNGIKDDNRLTNLRWGSRKENSEDRARHGTEHFGTGRVISKLTENDVIDMRNRYRNKTASTYSLAKEYNLSTNTIWSAVTGKTWKHVQGAIKNERN